MIHFRRFKMQYITIKLSVSLVLIRIDFKGLRVILIVSFRLFGSLCRCSGLIIGSVLLSVVNKETNSFPHFKNFYHGIFILYKRPL